jgi:hypothetical protein
MLVALGALASAAAIVSFATWILLRRGPAPPGDDAPATDDDAPAPEPEARWIAD